MNVRWYLALYDEAGDAMYPMLGLTPDYFAASGMGGFDLEHHLWYAAEVHVGDNVVFTTRILAEFEADPLLDVYGKRDSSRALFDLRVRACACGPRRPSHCPLPGAGGGQDRRLHHRAPRIGLARAGLGIHGIKYCFDKYMRVRQRTVEEGCHRNGSALSLRQSGERIRLDDNGIFL